MFGPPGHLYCYFSYGMHVCAQRRLRPRGHARRAVLLRAGEVVDGLDLARERRAAAPRDRDLARGPARLCQALGIGLDARREPTWPPGPVTLELGRARRRRLDRSAGRAARCARTGPGGSGSRGSRACRPTARRRRCGADRRPDLRRAIGSGPRFGTSGDGAVNVLLVARKRLPPGLKGQRRWVAARHDTGEDRHRVDSGGSEPVSFCRLPRRRDREVPGRCASDS